MLLSLQLNKPNSIQRRLSQKHPRDHLPKNLLKPLLRTSSRTSHSFIAHSLDQAFTVSFRASYNDAIAQTSLLTSTRLTDLPYKILLQIVLYVDISSANSFAQSCGRASQIVRTVFEEVWEKMPVVLQDDMHVSGIRSAMASWSLLLGSVRRMLEMLCKDVVEHWKWIMDNVGTTESILWRMGSVVSWEFGCETTKTGEEMALMQALDPHIHPDRERSEVFVWNPRDLTSWTQHFWRYQGRGAGSSFCVTLSKDRRNQIAIQESVSNAVALQDVVNE